MFRHAVCVLPYQRIRSSMTSFPPLRLEYVAASLRPYAERIDLVNFWHERTPSSQPFIRPETDLVCHSINWRNDLDSSQHIADLRKQIDKRFHGPLHVAAVVTKLLWVAHWQVLARATQTISVFLMLLIATQADRKVRRSRARQRAEGWQRSTLNSLRAALCRSKPIH